MSNDTLHAARELVALYDATKTLSFAEREPYRMHARNHAPAIAQALLDAQAENERLRAALTPSAETKAAYMGEFSVPLPDVDEDGNEVMRRANVPWVTIKEIMAAISRRALAGKEG